MFNQPFNKGNESAALTAEALIRPSTAFGAAAEQFARDAPVLVPAVAARCPRPTKG